jgi:RecA-family ATPase
MKQPAPHNSAQAFLDDQGRRADEWQRHGSGLSGEHGQRETVQAVSGSLCAASLEGKLIPSRRWIVEVLIPAGNVTSVNGDGGLGKSLLAQQLLTSTSIGRPWLGLPTVQCPSLGVFCEDDLDELHIRQAAINEHYGCSFADLKDCHWIPRVGQANVMMAFANDGKGCATPFYRQVCEQVRRLSARLVVLDSLHDLFSGDENRRGAARQFVGALRSIVLPLDGAILLLAHPSLSGMNSGTGMAGSTAWHNAVRSRLYLTRPNRRRPDQPQEQEEEGDPNARVVRTMKANYGPSSGKIPLLWRNGVFVRQDDQQAPSFVDKIEIDRLALDALRELVGRDSRVPLDPHAATAFPNAARQLPRCKHLSQAALVGALDRLIASGKAVKVEMGAPSKRRAYVRPSDMHYPGEVKEA